MHTKIIELNQSMRTDDYQDLRAGDVVRVHRKIVESGKERIQVFEGMIIAKKGGQSSSPTITVRKVSQGVGVEIIVPVYSPGVEKIELVKRARVRRSKLYYVRNRSQKSLRLKYDTIDPNAADIEVGKVEQEPTTDDPQPTTDDSQSQTEETQETEMKEKEHVEKEKPQEKSEEKKEDVSK